MHIRLRGESLQQHDEDKYVWVVLVSSFTEYGRLPEQAIAQQSWPPSEKDRKTDRRRHIPLSPLEPLRHFPIGRLGRCGIYRYWL